jgi:predicted adenylyl cyclase CyaB
MALKYHLGQCLSLERDTLCSGERRMAAGADGSAPKPTIETEGKWRLDGAEAIHLLRARLRELNAERVGQEQEQNQLFDLPTGALVRNERVLRLRVIDAGRGGRLTVKGAATHGDGIKAREELEVIVDNAETMRSILDRLGYGPTVEYPKVRETWRLGTLEIALDELPFGWFCEIEGPHADILHTARTLDLQDPEPESYPTLMARYLADTSR